MRLYMPRSPVQFQKGQSLAEFTDRYGSEEQCRAALFQARWPQGFECPECGRKRCCRLRCRNVFQCTRCRHQVSLTAGTVFANTKLPLTRWFLAMYLLTQSKNGLSAMALGRSVGSQLQHGLVAEAQTDAGDEGTGRERPAGPHRAGRRCLPGGRNPRRQTRTRGAGQDAVRGGRAGHRRRPAGGVADELRERVPQAGDCGLGPPASAAGDGGLLGRTGLLPGSGGSRL